MSKIEEAKRKYQDRSSPQKFAQVTNPAPRQPDQAAFFPDDPVRPSLGDDLLPPPGETNPRLAPPVNNAGVLGPFITDQDWATFRKKFEQFVAFAHYSYDNPLGTEDEQTRAAKLYGVHSDDDATRLFLDGILSDVTVASITQLAKEFPPLHVEPLLDQAQELLQRALQDRQTYYEANAKSIQIGLELEEFARLDMMHEQERLDGADVIAETRAATALQAEQKSYDYNSQFSLPALKDLDSYMLNSQSGIIEVRSLASYLSAAPYLDKENSGDKVNYIFPGIPPRNKAYHMQAFGRSIAEFDFEQSHKTVLAQRWQMEALCQVSLSNLTRLKAELEWVRKEAVHRNRRLSSSRDLFKRKRAAVLADGGPLNFSQQRDQAASRFSSNLTKAMTRIFSISNALKTIYQFSNPLPPTGGNQLLELSWLWVQDAIDHVHKINRSEQNLVVQLSLKQLMGDDAWKVASDSGKWPFSIPDSAFADLRCLRLRGISAHVVGENTGGAWRIRLKPPEKSRYVLADGTVVVIDKAGTKAVSYGRVLTWDPLRPADVFGVIGLHNVSPFGSLDATPADTWEATMGDTSSLGKKRSGIVDILLDLHLQARVA